MIKRLPPPVIMQRQRGFTLIEMIVVMVVTGVLAGVMMLFIRQPLRNYAESAARAELTDIADLALRRMARELRTALPNSTRVSVVNGVWLLEFIPTKAGARYLAVEDGTATASKPALSFTDASATTFTVINPIPLAPYAIAVKDYVVVYNLGSGFANADAYAGSDRAYISAVVTDAAAGVTTVTMGADPDFPGKAVNPFVVAGIPNSSPDHRFQVVGKPVTFRCVSSASGVGTLTRYWGYGFSAAQADPEALTTKSKALMADHVLGCDFSVTQAASQQAALIGMSIALARSNPGANSSLETVTLTNQVHVDNTP